MPEGPRITDDVRQLLADHVDSLEKLELLSLVVQQRDAHWTLETAAAAIRLPADILERPLAELRASGLIAIVPGRIARFRYVAPMPEIDETCHRLVAAYDADRVEVLKLASSLAVDRVRRSAATLFADAFRLRRKAEDGGDHG